MNNSMVTFIFLCSTGSILFWANLVSRSEICWKWNLVARLIRICRIQWWCSLFLFSTGNTLFGKIWTKKWKILFKIKFGTVTNLEIQNSKVVFPFSFLDRKYPSWLNLIQKIKIGTLDWNVVLGLIRICRIQWLCSLFLF